MNRVILVSLPLIDAKPVPEPDPPSLSALTSAIRREEPGNPSAAGGTALSLRRRPWRFMAIMVKVKDPQRPRP